MKFNIFINDPVIHAAAELVETHYKDEGYLQALGLVPRFNYSYDSGQTVAHKIANNTLSMDIKAYKTWNPYSKVIGYASGKTIYCNLRKINLPLKDRVENFFHEPIHLLGYSHKGNSNNEFNQGTAPYLASFLFVKYLESIGKL